ncbi:uncharacterized protein BO97DRAFT_428513 [Aspergillus homomorphus CBS 101889]|uniref:Metallo-beta-lactamase domain-containing protein n=1 Tax=Aspergillus homomorphus (strain CBS 101889) TaxID=1450537 RepID=A0A395HJT6_ASPHC|nr:hypothetical protein BO97DRAFT_428513 [Aspergillus homomorphus CBS 101889]RAL08202.1 hypothetical protein BO97DRAFT_428513 [Aspergillus homomorphus CBS 101889]
MSSNLFTGDPNKVTVIRQLNPDITTFSVPFARFGVLKFGGRGTLVKLPSGSLLIFSPVTLTAEIQSVIAATGTGQVAYIVAPDIEHHIHLSAWKAAYPEALIIAPEGLHEKRQAQSQSATTTTDANPTFDIIYTPTNKHTLTITPEFHATFEIEYVHSHGNREIVLLHKPTRMLIQADLLFNLPAWEQYSLTDEDAGAGWWNRTGMGWMKTGTAAERKAQARFVWYVLAAKDRKGFGESIRRIAGWGGLAGVVPCHGDVIEGEDRAREVFEGVFGDFLKE